MKIKSRLSIFKWIHSNENGKKRRKKCFEFSLAFFCCCIWCWFSVKLSVLVFYVHYLCYADIFDLNKKTASFHFILFTSFFPFVKVVLYRAIARISTFKKLHCFSWPSYSFFLSADLLQVQTRKEPIVSHFKINNIYFCSLLLMPRYYEPDSRKSKGAQ